MLRLLCIIFMYASPSFATPAVDLRPYVPLGFTFEIQSPSNQTGTVQAVMLGELLNSQKSNLPHELTGVTSRELYRLKSGTLQVQGQNSEPLSCLLLELLETGATSRRTRLRGLLVTDQNESCVFTEESLRRAVAFEIEDFVLGQVLSAKLLTRGQSTPLQLTSTTTRQEMPLKTQMKFPEPSKRSVAYKGWVQFSPQRLIPYDLVFFRKDEPSNRNHNKQHQVDALLTLYIGGRKSSEVLSSYYRDVSLDTTKGQVTLQQAGADPIITGIFNNTTITGILTSQAFGSRGNLTDTAPRTEVSPISGKYRALNCSIDIGLSKRHLTRIDLLSLPVLNPADRSKFHLVAQFLCTDADGSELCAFSEDTIANPYSGELRIQTRNNLYRCQTSSNRHLTCELVTCREPHCAKTCDLEGEP